MTNMELIDYCNSIDGECSTCEEMIENVCNKFEDKYGTTPYKEDILSDYMYTSDVIGYADEQEHEDFSDEIYED